MNSEYHATLAHKLMHKNGKGHFCSVLRYSGSGHIIERRYIPSAIRHLINFGCNFW